MAALGERLDRKVVAEEVCCVTLPKPVLGVAVEIDDADNARACEAVMAALTETLLPLDGAEARPVRIQRDAQLLNRRDLKAD